MLLHAIGLSLLTCLTVVIAFDNSRYDNLVVYWGQNSYGATHSDTAGFQQRLGFYCNDNVIDVFPVAFLNVFFGAGGLPSINLANTCNPTDNATFPGTALPNCASLATDIATCQSKGKIITLSLGGATGAVGFQSDSQASSFAQTIWNLFLGGSSATRPFGNAVLDGIDLDIEGGSSDYYVTFVNTIRSLASGSNKQYFITAAPQCVFPDAALGSVLNAGVFDAIYVQFYNNYCGLQNFGQASNWNFGIWDDWARSLSPSKNVKVYIGAPASSSAAGSGYVDAPTLSSIAVQMRKSFPSFGGVMMWDASQAYANNRFDAAIKTALVSAGGTGFVYPACSPPAFVSGTNYAAGSQVTFGGYVWEANWSASSQPTSTPGGEWSAISACGGPAATTGLPTSSTAAGPTSSTVTTTSKSSSSSPTSSSATVLTSTTVTTTSKSSSSSPPSSTTAVPGASCAAIAPWSSTIAYTGGAQVVYGSHLWTAKWWSEADTPGGAAGDWTDDGPCSSTQVATKAVATATPEATTSLRKSSRFIRI